MQLFNKPSPEVSLTIAIEILECRDYQASFFKEVEMYAINAIPRIWPQRLPDELKSDWPLQPFSAILPFPTFAPCSAERFTVWLITKVMLIVFIASGVKDSAIYTARRNFRKSHQFLPPVSFSISSSCGVFCVGCDHWLRENTVSSALASHGVNTLAMSVYPPATASTWSS